MDIKLFLLNNLKDLVAMFDEMRFRINLPFQDQAAMEMAENSRFFQQLTGECDEKGFMQCLYRGMRLKYSPQTGKGWVKGSLHTFSKGDNNSLFSAQEASLACSELATELGIPAQSLVLHALEIGLNLFSTQVPTQFLDSLLHHKNSQFYTLRPPRGCVRPMEFVATHAEYSIKFYDKAAYARKKRNPVPHDRQLLRFEVQYHCTRQLRKVTGLEQVTLADLANPAVLEAFASELRKHWQLSQRRIQPTYLGLNIRQGLLLHAANNPGVWRGTRARTPKSTHQHHRKIARELYRKAVQKAGPHLFDLLFEQTLDIMITTLR
jgi:hypothetical protein